MSAARPRVLVVGLGPIGASVVAGVHGDPGLELAGAVDAAPAMAGRDLAEVVPGVPAGTRVLASLDEGLASGISVAVLCTTSRLAVLEAQIAAAVQRGVAVVSTCEELAEPYGIDAALARRVDELARQHGVAVLGTGINPGFVMDRLPLVLAQACVRVDHVRVERVLDAARRRGPLQVKVGAGLSPQEFEAGVAAGRLGHVGLGASARLLARGLGYPDAEIEETIEPVVVTASNPRGHLAPGCVAGVHQEAWVRDRGREIASLELEMSIGAPSPHDRIVITGDPPVDVLVDPGYHGDRGTTGTVLSGIRRVLRARPGLMLASD